NEIHDEELQAAGVEHAVDGRDVRMTEAANRACFAAEPLDHARVAGQRRRHDLDRDLPIEVDVVGEVHGAHAAVAELANDLEFAQRRALQRLEHTDPRDIGIGAVLPTYGAWLLVRRGATAFAELVFRAHGVATESARGRSA